MNQPLLKPCIGVQEVTPIAENLVLLYRRSRLLEREKRAAEPPSDIFPILSLGDLAAMSQHSPLERVEDAISGLDYAAWCIGEVLICIGGLELMHLTFGVFEDLIEDAQVGDAISWLDHRWDGVSDKAGAEWVA